MLNQLGVRSVLSAALLVALCGGCGGTTKTAQPPQTTTSTAAGASDLRLAEPAVAILATGSSPASGRRTTVGLIFRLERPLRLKPGGNVRATVRIARGTSEWVSRIGRRRVFCYQAAEVNAPRPGLRPGDVVPIEITAGGRTLRASVPVRSSEEAIRRRHSIGCGGRKER